MSSIYANDWRCRLIGGGREVRGGCCQHPSQSLANYESRFYACFAKPLGSQKKNPKNFSTCICLSPPTPGNVSSRLLLWVLSSKPRQTLNIACRQTTTWTSGHAPPPISRWKKWQQQKAERERKKDMKIALHTAQSAHRRRRLLATYPASEHQPRLAAPRHSLTGCCSPAPLRPPTIKPNKKLQAGHI